MCHPFAKCCYLSSWMVSQGQKEDRISSATSMARLYYGTGVSDFVFTHLNLDSDLDH